MRSRASLTAAALLLAGCAHASAAAYDETGTASWYGEEVAGRPTASGERFDPDGITVAHRTLPLGSYVAVTALDSGRTVVARVTDRGPWHGDRLVDLSRGAAHRLGVDVRPVSRVRVRAVGEAAALGAASAVPVAPPAPVPFSASDRYIIRVATFSSEPRAAALASALGATLVPAGGLWRVVMGPYTGADAAQRARDAAARRGYGDAVILAQP